MDEIGKTWLSKFEKETSGLVLFGRIDKLKYIQNKITKYVQIGFY